MSTIDESFDISQRFRHNMQTRRKRFLGNNLTQKIQTIHQSFDISHLDFASNLISCINPQMMNNQQRV